ncbi:Integrin-linked protein kinase family [Rhynchospora pubera]|uniref:Integrin-linked protein kinase family n=1 Tax=Rhynchospora pubera TaxID=906938 RepID=A0AAV8FG44_9POAL|nr:Integrin-linked protein kinase family [Rhynchospora pubera]
MEVATKLKNGISRQLSAGASLSKAAGMQLWRQASALGLARQASANRFMYGRQSSLDPNRREPDPGGSTGSTGSQLSVPENLDSTMQLLFVASHGDIEGVEELLKEGIDVNSIDLDGRTALHIASCEGHLEVVKLLLWWRANINARDRWGSTPAADAKYYGNTEIYDLLRSRGAKVPKTIGKTPMSVANPQDVPEYELNPLHLEFKRNDELSKGYHVAKWNGTKVCVKILDKDAVSDPESINAFRHELTILEKARHPNLVQFVGAITQHVPMMIVSDYHPKGDLGSYLQKKGRLGINYLHESKPDPIIHSNLCPKNIFRDNTNRLKVAGFGLIKMTKVSEDEYRFANTVEFSDNSYVAPEVYKNDVFGRGVDAFSFGLILYEMIEGAPAFYPKGAHEVVKMICLEGQRPPFKNKMKSYLSDSKELIQECWDPRPASRPTFSEIIARLSKMDSICVKQSRWKDNFKLPWK